MESTSHAAVYAPLDCQWNDIGTWTMINELRQNDDKGGTVNVDATNCSVHSDASHMVALVGVENLTVVIEGNRILIAAKDHIQDIKNVVTALRESGREDLL